jgi:hypothetical protein
VCVLNVKLNCILFYLIYDLFNDAICSLDFITSNGKMTNKLEQIWKKTVIAKFETLSQFLNGGTKANYEKPQLGSGPLFSGYISICIVNSCCIIANINS